MLPPIKEEERKFRWADLADLADFEAGADSNVGNDHETAYNNQLLEDKDDEDE